MMPLLRSFGTWLHGTALSHAMAGGIPFLWPMCETLHFIGLALLVGIAGLLDLRMIGMGKGIPIASLQRLMPWAVGGFVLNAITGFLFFSGDPFQYLNNVAFWWKMLFIGLAGVNVLVFYVTGVSQRVDRVGAEQDAPFAAKCTGAISLLLWVGVMYWGRMLPFIGNAF
jgi:hypothetical protein